MSTGDLRNIAPLLDAYLSYFERKRSPFTIPGHKQRASRLDAGLGALVDSDIPLYGGLDEIKLTNQVLTEAEKLAADLWGADFARFSTGGSTHANQALGKPGDKVAVSRTAHRSVLSALVLAGLEPLWLSPEIDLVTGVPIGIPVSELERVLPENPIALLLTEPGYLGSLSDIGALVKIAHSHSIPVIIDAAWGGHFGFHKDIPAHVLQMGADALITSVHKALPGYSASALLLAQTKFLSADRLEQSFETTHTTSPAGAPLASIDATRALLQTRGPELLGDLLSNVSYFKEKMQSEFSENALGEHGIRVEMADQDTVVFLATLADTRADFDYLADVLIGIARTQQSTPRPSATALSWSVVPTVGISMRDAYFASTEMVSAREAVGRVSADLIAPYPPGVAVIAPGEILTEQIVQGLSASQKAGVRIAYATDPTLAKYRVVVK